MLKAGFDLSQARVLVTNDDGIGAPGLLLLEDILRPLVKEVITVAPETEQSGVSHSTTTRLPVRLKSYGDNRYSVSGTPPDCVLFALGELMRENPPDLVLSGINNGQNVAEDVHYSGTIAACFEAGLANIPAIAFSQEHVHGAQTNFAPAQARFSAVLEQITSLVWPEGSLLTVNFPDKPLQQILPLKPARLGRRIVGVRFEKGVDPRGRDFYWNAWSPNVDSYVDGAPDTDLALLQQGHITVTPVRVDPVDREGVAQLRETLDR